ncbi:hypothetical protein Tco_0818913 [Tanacetum coccineum]
MFEGAKDDDDSEDRLEPGSHKENPKYVDDDDGEEKVDEKKNADMGSLETRTEEMQTPILTPPRSPRIILSSNKNITQELTNIVPLPTTTTSKIPYFKRRISSKYSHLSSALRRMCRRQGYMIHNMEQECVTTKYFWKTHNKVDRVLHEIVPQLVERDTDDLIENNLKPSIAATIIEDRDAFRSEVPDLVSQEFNAQAPKIIEELFKITYKAMLFKSILPQPHQPKHLHQLIFNRGEKSKRNKASKSSKSAKGYSSKHSTKDSTTYVSTQQQHEWDAWVEETVIDKDEVIPKDETSELITKLQNVDKHIPTIFDRARIEATLNDMLCNQFNNAKEYAYHLEQATNFIENQIVWESGQEDIRLPVPGPLIFFGPSRNPNEPPRYLYNKDLFFLKNGNTKEKKYILSHHKIHAEQFPEADLEERMNRWVHKEFKNFNKDARLSIQHWKDSWHKRVYKQNQKRVRNNLEDYFSNHRITEIVKITTDQLHGLDFMEQIIVMRENDKPDSFSEADFKYLNKNDIEDLYYLFRNYKVNYRETKLVNSLITFIISRVIWERVHDFQLGIESYQVKVNITAPTLTFPGIEAYESYSIVDKPNTGLIYLNNKDEKWVMYFVEIVKFCDDTLEKVTKEVKLKILQSEP